MKHKQTIQVRQHHLGERRGTYEVVAYIKRKVYVDQVGNFNRFACRFNRRTYCVNSDAGDIGDPFRADKSYLKSLYIDLRLPCQWNLP